VRSPHDATRCARAAAGTPIRGGHDDRGIAALELGIFLSLLMLLAFGALPLYALLRSYQRVSKASTATLRYATAVDSNAHRTGGVLTRKPSYDEVAAFAHDAANDPSLEVAVTVCQGGTCAAATGASPIPASAGDTVTVTIRQHVDMSVLGSVANAIASLSGAGKVFPDNDVTVTSTATAREE
jgi:Flp pilus assembly protein TadG